MAKKLSTLVIDATVNTTGIDKAVSSINNKLKNVRGSGGSGGSRDGRFSAGINPNAYVGNDSSIDGFAGAIAAAAVLRGKTPNIYDQRKATIRKFGTGSAFFGSKIGSSMTDYAMGTAGALLAARRGEITGEYGQYLSQQLLERHIQTRESFRRLSKARGYTATGLGFQVLGRGIREAMGAYPTAFSSPFAGLGRGNNMNFGGFGGLIGTASLAGAARYMTNFRQNTYGQFSDLDQFVNTSMFDAAKGLRTTGFGQRGASRTLSQSLMLGARFNNPNQPSILEKGGMGIQDYYQNMMFGLGAFISDPVGAVGQSLYPGSPMRQALGENPNDLSWFAKMQKSFFDTFTQTRRGSV